MTIRERFGRLDGLRVVYLGDGNNVCASLMVASRQARHGVRRCDSLAGTVLRRGGKDRARAGGSVELVDDPAGAVEGADVLYTDVWTLDGPGR